MSRKQTKFLVGVIVIVAAVGVLAFFSMQGNSSYYMRPSELLERVRSEPGSVYGEQARVGGIIVTDSVKGSAARRAWRFKVSDEKGDGQIRPVSSKQATLDKTIAVKYQGIVPDAFKEGVLAIVDGKYNKDGVFVAEKIIAKCPSKYESAKVTDK